MQSGSEGGYHDAEKINAAVILALGALFSAPSPAADSSDPGTADGALPESDVSVKFHALDYSQSVMNLSQGSSESRLNDMRGELLSLDVEEDSSSTGSARPSVTILRRRRPLRRLTPRQGRSRASTSPLTTRLTARSRSCRT